MFLLKKLCMNGHFRNPKLFSKKTKTKTKTETNNKKTKKQKKKMSTKKKKKHGTTNDTS